MVGSLYKRRVPLARRAKLLWRRRRGFSRRLVAALHPPREEAAEQSRDQREISVPDEEDVVHVPRHLRIRVGRTLGGVLVAIWFDGLPFGRGKQVDARWRPAVPAGVTLLFAEMLPFRV